MTTLQIRNVTVLGAGTMGSQIAGYLADLGYEIDLFDLPGQAQKAWDLLVKNGRCTLGGRNRVTPREMGKDDACLATADLIVEAVFEEIKVKNQVCATIQKYARADCIIATNTSGISINEMAKALSPERRQRYFGVHFFNPLKALPLAELIAGRETDTTLFMAFADYAEKKLGKGVVIARDTPNFIGNRIGGYALYAPFRLNSAGLTPVDIDQIWKTIWGWEPLKTWDIVGLQLAKPVAQNVYDRAGNDPLRDLWKPDVAWIEQLVKKGLLGRGSKSKSGFFALGDNRQKLMYDFAKNDYVAALGGTFPSLQAAQKAKWPQSLETLLSGSDAAAEFARQSFFGVIAYAAAMTGEICDQITDIDKAMRWGFNWPRGPFEVADAYGLAKCIAGIEAIGNGRLIPQWLKELAAQDKGSLYTKDPKATFYSRTTNKMELLPLVEGGIYPETFLADPSRSIFRNDEAAVLNVSSDRAPLCLVVLLSRGNTAGPGVLVALHKAMDWAEKQQGAVVIGNTGRDFCPGANLRLLLERSEGGKAAEIEQLIRDGHEATQRLTYCNALTVAAPQGYTLGGGSEIALGAKIRVVNQSVIWGQPEINPGIIPAWGGCMRLLRHMMRGLPPYYLWGEFWTREVAGDHIDPVWRLVAWAEMSRDAHHAKEMGFLDRNDIIVPAQGLGQPFVLAQALKVAEATLYAGYRAPEPFTFNLPGKALHSRFRLLCEQGVATGMFPAHNGKVAMAVANVMCGGDTKLGEPVSEAKLLELERTNFMEVVMTREAQAAMKRVLKS